MSSDPQKRRAVVNLRAIAALAEKLAGRPRNQNRPLGTRVRRRHGSNSEGGARRAEHPMIPPTQPESPSSRGVSVETGGSGKGRLSGYPDYLDDPAGLERFRQSVVECRDRHEMASVNYNSLARLIDTIERLRLSADTSALEAETGSLCADRRRRC